jgi:hypothetical protein
MSLDEAGLGSAQSTNGKYNTPGSKWELYAKEMVLWKYPGHEIKFQTPTIRVDNTNDGTMRPDLSVYKDQKLVAVVEVGDLSRPDKLSLLKHALPDIAVWWIPKTDLLSIVMPSLDDFRLAKYAREEVGAGLLNELFRERQEIVELRKALAEGLRFMRRFVTQVKNMHAQMWDVTQTLKKWDEQIAPVEFKENGVPDHDEILNDLTQNNGAS